MIFLSECLHWSRTIQLLLHFPAISFNFLPLFFLFRRCHSITTDHPTTFFFSPGATNLINTNTHCFLFYFSFHFGYFQVTPVKTVKQKSIHVKVVNVKMVAHASETQRISGKHEKLIGMMQCGQQRNSCMRLLFNLHRKPAFE